MKRIVGNLTILMALLAAGSPAVAGTVVYSPALDGELHAPWAPEGAGYALRPVGLMDAKAYVSFSNFRPRRDVFVSPYAVDLRFGRRRWAFGAGVVWTSLDQIQARDKHGKRLGEFAHTSYAATGGIGIQIGPWFRVGMAGGMVREQSPYQILNGTVLAGEVLHSGLPGMRIRLQMQGGLVGDARIPTTVNAEVEIRFGERDHTATLGILRGATTTRQFFGGYTWPIRKGGVALVLRGGTLVGLGDAVERFAPVGSVELVLKHLSLSFTLREGTSFRRGAIFQASIR